MLASVLQALDNYLVADIVRKDGGELSATILSHLDCRDARLFAIPALVWAGGAPHDGTRQHDQVGWSGGGPHIVIRQYTFAILRATRAVASVRYHESPHDPSGAFM